MYFTNPSNYSKKIKNRRPKRRKQQFSKKLNIYSCNAAGIKNKLFSLNKVLNELQVSIFCIQETHLAEEGKIKFDEADKICCKI